MPENTKEQVLSVRDLDITFKTTAGPVHAIRGVNIDLYKGETVALVGESGSGKSVTMKAAMGILAKNATVNSGSIQFSYHHADGSPETVDLLQKDKKWIRRHINGKRIAMVFQDPMTSLDPTMTIGKQIMEGMLWHFKMPKAEAYKKALELLEAMDEGALLFPSWISCGGAPNELAAYLPRYGEEADGYAGESTLLDRVIIYSSAQLAAMLTEPDALWDTGCPGLGPAAGCISLSILKSCEDVEGAWEFLSFAYGPEARPALSASGEYELPASLSFLEAQLSEFEGVDGDALELAREYVGGLSLDA